MSDVRYAIRALAKNPVFSLTVVGVLTLGIGLNAAVFTMLKSMALSPLAGVDGSARLAVIFGETSTGRQRRACRIPTTSTFAITIARSRDSSARASSTVNLGRGRGARQVWGELVTGNYFQVLGVRAERGRTLLPSDEIAPGRHPVVVISDGLWRRDFGADPDIVGKTVEINNYPLTVVGVADPAFHGTIVSLRRRSVHSGDDGAAARLHVRKPADDAVRHPLRPPRRGLLSAGLPAAGHDARERRRADRRALGRRCRAIGR